MSPCAAAQRSPHAALMGMLRIPARTLTRHRAKARQVTVRRVMVKVAMGKVATVMVLTPRAPTAMAVTPATVTPRKPLARAPRTRPARLPHILKRARLRPPRFATLKRGSPGVLPAVPLSARCRWASSGAVP